MKKKHIEILNAFGDFLVIFWEKVGFFALGHSFYIESHFPAACSTSFYYLMTEVHFCELFHSPLLNGVVDLPEDVYMVSLPESRKNPLESLEDLAELEGEVTPTSFLGLS